jgi:hypothetical protein
MLCARKQLAILLPICFSFASTSATMLGPAPLSDFLQQAAV